LSRTARGGGGEKTGKEQTILFSFLSTRLEGGKRKKKKRDLYESICCSALFEGGESVKKVKKTRSSCFISLARISGGERGREEGYWGKRDVFGRRGSFVLEESRGKNRKVVTFILSSWS